MPYGDITHRLVAELNELGAEEYKKRLVSLVAGLVDIAAGACCMTDGCSLDEPLCDVMMARAALRGTY